MRFREDIDSSEEQLADLGAVEEELHRMQQRDFVRRVEEKGLVDREKRLLEQAESQVEHLVSELDTFLQEHRLDAESISEEPTTGLPHQDVLRGQGGLLQAIDSDLEETLTSLKARVGAKWAEGKDGREAWHKDYEDQDRAYQEILREFQEKGQSVEPDRYIQLQKRKLDLEQLKNEMVEKQRWIDELNAQRRNLLEQLRQVRRRMYEVRQDKAAELTQLLDRNVRISVCPQANRQAYKGYLEKLFTGLDVRNPHRDRLADAEAPEPQQEAQSPVDIGGETRYLIPRIPRYLDPIDLAEAIWIEHTRNDDEESLLRTCFDVGSDPMRRNMARLDPEKLFELEIFAVPDLPVIELRVGSGDLGYRVLSALSVGQRCTALLSLVLLESPATLLIDQPEDDLDNQFIFDQIVATLRREKERRQFLIATHNANIPVSGDAELIIVLQADDKCGRVESDCIGSIDSEPIKQFVERILEGGEAAFKIRKEKYGIR